MTNDRIIQKISLLILGAISLLFLIHGCYNLLSTDNLPVDLALRFWQTKDLILYQIDIYSEQVHTLYPPSFFAFLTPILGFAIYQSADWVWAIVNLGGLVIISIYLNQHSTAVKWVLPFSFFAFHSIAHGLGVGRVHIFVLSHLIAFLWIYELENPPKWLKGIGVLALSILGLTVLKGL